MKTTVLVFAAFASVVAVAAGERPVTFNRDVVPILQKRCQSCHRPDQAAPMSLLTYEAARPWAKAIRNAVASRKMPPWFADPRYGHFANDPSLSQAEIDTLIHWVNDGAFEGDPRDLPPPVRWPHDGWQIRPDVVVSLPAYRVPAKGTVEWVYVTVPSGFATDKDTWVTSIEVLPGEPSVVHHAGVFIKPHTADAKYREPVLSKVARGEDGIAKALEGFGGDPITGLGAMVALYVPGFRAMDYRVHRAAQLIPAHSDLVVQLHYTPNGKQATDITRIGFTLAKEPPERRFIVYSPQPPAISDPAVFRIPAGDPNWQSPSVDGVFHVKAELVWFLPHMHLRGKDMTYSLTYPGSKPEIVLSVPKYDFAWQMGYDAASPISVTKGTRLHVDAHYDNSANNPANPAPDRDVYGGTQTWEEMMVPFFGVVVDAHVDPRKVMTLPGQAGELGAGR
ncbi:MAG: cytochrome c [Bryobacteraceae bacterium]